MKRIAIAAVLLGFAAAAVSAAPQAQIVEEIVAIVNNDIITLSDVRQEYQVQLQGLRAQNLPQEQYDEAYKALRSGLLEKMIVDLLLLQKSRELDLNVSEQLKGNLEKIKQENNFTSDEDLRRAVESQGIPYGQWLKQYEDEMRKQGVIYMEVDRAIVLDEAEVVKYYKAHPEEFTVPAEYTLRAVYLTTAGRSAAQLEALKQEVANKLASGTSFEDVAAEMSDAPVKDLKGDLGTIKKGQLDKTLETAVEKLKVGEASPWIEALNGLYLIKLEDKKETHLLPFDEAKSQVQDKLFGEKRQQKSGEYLAELKARSYIKILRPNPLEY
jgi:peptidyl-prolyl cis-trans isomerase SurA